MKGDKTRKAPPSLILAAAMVVGLAMMGLGMVGRRDSSDLLEATVTVNAVPVDLYDVIGRIDPSEHLEAGADDEAAMALLERIILDEVVYQRGVDLGLLRNDAIIRRRLVQEVREFAMSEARTRDLSEQELREFYDTHRAVFVREPRLRIADVFLRAQRGHDRSDEINDLYQRLVEGELWDRIGDLSDPLPIDLGERWLEPADLTELFGASYTDAALATDVGEFSEPVRTAFGYHIITIEGRQGSEPLTFEEAEPAVRIRYRRQIAREALVEYLWGARDEAVVVVSPEAVTQLQEVLNDGRIQ